MTPPKNAGRPKRPCAGCGTPTWGTHCRACWKPIRHPRVPCSPEMAEAIVAILLTDPGVGSLHDHGGRARRGLV